MAGVSQDTAQLEGGAPAEGPAQPASGAQDQRKSTREGGAPAEDPAQPSTEPELLRKGHAN
eukprot:m.137501 g.137501  ORF g.137501 m.137501 type:complete len:61 (+) comp22684_c0_seq8:330-512(+)